MNTDSKIIREKIIRDPDGGVYLQDPDGQGWRKVDAREPGMPWEVAVGDTERQLQWLKLKQELAELSKPEERLLKELEREREAYQAFDELDRARQELCDVIAADILALKKLIWTWTAGAVRFITRMVRRK